jgi:hypothetical protein
MFYREPLRKYTEWRVDDFTAGRLIGTAVDRRQQLVLGAGPVPGRAIREPKIVIRAPRNIFDRAQKYGPYM